MDLMAREIEVEKSSGWRAFLRRHWAVFALLLVAAALAITGTMAVFLWFTGNAQSTSLVPATLGLWTMANVVSFILHLIFWELILVGIPGAVGAFIGWQWWRRVPYEEKKDYHWFGKRSRTSRGSGGISLLLFIAFAIKVYVDGKWNVAISTWKLDYVVGSMITILIWIAVIIGIPLLLGLVWWIHREITKKA